MAGGVVGGEKTNRLLGVIPADELSFSPKFQRLAPPELPGLPQAAAFLLELAPEDKEEIAFTNLRYFRMEASEELAIVKNGELVSRKATMTESGTLTAIFADRASAFFTALARQRATAEG